ARASPTAAAGRCPRRARAGATRPRLRGRRCTTCCPRSGRSPAPAPGWNPVRRRATTSHAEPTDSLLLLFLAMAGRHLGQRRLVDLVAGGHRHLHRRQGPKGDRALPAFEDGPLADDGAGAQLVDLLAVELGSQDSVEQQEQLVAGISLLDEGLA